MAVIKPPGLSAVLESCVSHRNSCFWESFSVLHTRKISMAWKAKSTAKAKDVATRIMERMVRMPPKQHKDAQKPTTPQGEAQRRRREKERERTSSLEGARSQREIADISF